MRPLAPLLLACALVLGGCGFGTGGSGGGDVSLIVTRDFGSQTIGEVGPGSVEGAESVMRMLQRSFKVQTRYSGRFVQSIDGLSGGREDGRRRGPRSGRKSTSPNP